MNETIIKGAESFSFSKYVDKGRFSCYWHQISEVTEQKPESLLIIGPGDGIVPTIIREHACSGIKVSTFDFDPSLKPDIYGDVREIGTKIEKDSFDCILCCQVLEHIPYEDFLAVLKALVEIAPTLVISIPCQYRKLGFTLTLPRINLQKEVYPDLGKNVFSCESHLWEAGTKDHPRTAIREDIRRICSIEKEYRVPEKPLNLFYVLKRK